MYLEKIVSGRLVACQKSAFKDGDTVIALTLKCCNYTNKIYR